MKKSVVVPIAIVTAVDMVLWLITLLVPAPQFLIAALIGVMAPLLIALAAEAGAEKAEDEMHRRHEALARQRQAISAR